MMNQDDRLKPQSSAYAFIALEASQNRFAAVLNKYYKEIGKDAMIIPMNIREDDIYYTLSNMKKSKLDGAFLASEYHKSIVELLDYRSEVVESCNLCDAVVLKNGKFYGDFIAPKALVTFLVLNGAKRVAIIGANEFAKALYEMKSELEFSFYDHCVEDYLKLNMQNADINRVVSETDLSSYDATVNLSDIEDLSVITKSSKINVDMKRGDSALKKLNADYYGYDQLLDVLTKEADKFFESEK